MKKYLLLILVGFFTFSIHAQQEILFDSENATGNHVTTNDQKYRLVANQAYDGSSAVWEKSDSIAYSYSEKRGSDIAAGKFDYDEQIIHAWDGFIFNLQNRALNTFNDNNQLILKVTQTYDGVNWEDKYRDIYEYDGSGNLVVEIKQNYSSGDWENNIRYVNSYDNGLRTVRLRQSWTGSEWEDVYRYVYTYDSNDNNTVRLIQYWDGTVWYNSSRDIREYDNNGNETLEIRQIWSNSEWTNSSKNITEYDDEGWRTTRQYQTWDDSSMSWEDNNRTLYSHESGNYYYHKILNEELDSGDWVNESKSEYTFTEFNKVDVAIHREWDGTVWVKSSKNDFHYEAYDDETSSLSTSVEMDVQVIPNPASDYVLFRNGNSTDQMQITIYNNNGQLIKNLEGRQSVKWQPGSSVQSGIYKYLIRINGKITSGQLVIQ